MFTIKKSYYSAYTKSSFDFKNTIIKLLKNITLVIDN